MKTSDTMTLSVAVAECAKFGNTIRAFAKVAEVAEFLYAQEQTQLERERALKAIQAEIDSAAAARDATQAKFVHELDLANRAAEKYRSDTLADAKDAREQADAADEAVRRARAEAQQCQEAARAAQAEVEAARAELQKVLDTIESAKAEALRRIGG